MTGLPELPEQIRRSHALRWYELVENHGFTGEHLRWYESPTRRQRAAVTMYGKPRPISPIGSRMPMSPMPTQIGEWDRQRQTRLSNPNDPLVIDSIGVNESLGLARERFSEVLRYYLLLWAFETKGDSDELADWSKQLQQSVSREVGELWRKSDRHSAWFDRACLPKIEDTLDELTVKAIRRARNFERKHLENPHLSLIAIVAADGDLKLASGFEETVWRQVIASTIEDRLSKKASRTLGVSAPKFAETASQQPSTATVANHPVPSSSGTPILSASKGRKRGPHPDLEKAGKVAEIVARIAPDGDWRSKLDEILEVCDKEELECPKVWRKKDKTCKLWQDYPDRDLAMKAVSYWLKQAKQRKPSAPETFS